MRLDHFNLSFWLRIIHTPCISVVYVKTNPISKPHIKQLIIYLLNTPITQL